MHQNHNYCLNIAEGEVIELDDTFVGRTQKRRERIIIYKLTKSQLKERKEKVEKVAKKKGIKKSKNTIKLIGITIYISNIKSTVVPSNQIHDMYSLRWQIEIIFKIWKSIFHLSNVKPVKIQRFKCQLYGKLILLILSSIIMFKMRSELLELEYLEASEIKSAQIISQHIQDIYFCFINEPQNLATSLIHVFNCIHKNWRKSH